MINGKEVDKMYKTKTNAEIGEYLSELIREEFGSQRQFCIACLEAYDNAVFYPVDNSGAFRICFYSSKALNR